MLTLRLKLNGKFKIYNLLNLYIEWTKKMAKNEENGKKGKNDEYN